MVCLLLLPKENILQSKSIMVRKRSHDLFQIYLYFAFEYLTEYDLMQSKLRLGYDYGA